MYLPTSWLLIFSLIITAFKFQDNEEGAYIGASSPSIDLVVEVFSSLAAMYIMVGYTLRLPSPNLLDEIIECVVEDLPVTSPLTINSQLRCVITNTSLILCSTNLY